jgi:tRNA 2-thiouridine synthesizing protein A
MDWLARLLGRGNTQKPLLARVETLPGLGQVRIAYVVDCIGAMCPRPQLLTRKIVEQIEDGEVIEVVTDNPAAAEAFPWLAETLACTFLLSQRNSMGWRLYLRKGLGQAGMEEALTSVRRNKQ